MQLSSKITVLIVLDVIFCLLRFSSGGHLSLGDVYDAFAAFHHLLVIILLIGYRHILIFYVALYSIFRHGYFFGEGVEGDDFIIGGSR